MPGQQDTTRNQKAPSANEDDERQDSPSANVLTKDDEQSKGEDTSRNPDAPEHGGYGRPV
jgi:hypothetical protein